MPELVLENSSIINNSFIGLEEDLGNNTLITGNIFSQNGLGIDEFGDSFGGAILAEETNCTVTNNAFNSNYDGLMLGIYDEDQNNTQAYYYNSFNNNSFTFDFNYRVPSNYTNQQVYFYNNFVNDSAYVNPDSFAMDDQYAPTAATFHLNTTLQAGARAYSAGRMVGGNYWAYPNGTGPSQTGTDANHDGFLDSAFDLFGNQTVYDYLPYSSSFVEFIDHLTITPTAATIAAGQSVNYTTTAYDQYGNAWNVSASYSVDGQPFTGSMLIGRVPGVYSITAAYSDKTVQTTLTVIVGPLTRFLIQVPQTATTGTPFTVNVVALDPAGNIVNSFTGSVTLSTNGATLSPTSTGAFTAGIWTGTVSISQAGTFTINVTDSNGHSGISNNITVTTVSPTPTPTSTTQIVQATKDDGSKVNLAITGNITSSQLSDITINTNQTAQTTTISFTVTGPSGSSGFSNITISKSSVNEGATPTVYIDGQPAENQGYTQDSQNYYVWFATSFSTHQVQVQFTGQATTEPQSAIWYVLIIVVAVALTAVVIALKRKHK